MRSNGERALEVGAERIEERAAQPSMLARTEEIQRQIQQLSGRDLQLWSIGILVILVLTSGLLALVLPNLVWASGSSTSNILICRNFSLG